MIYLICSLGLCVVTVSFVQVTLKENHDRIQQPIKFSHKIHARIGLTCEICHPTARRDAVAGFPETSGCMSCHQVIKHKARQIQRLEAYDHEKKPVPWVRIYKVPDFVYFSHKKHSDAGVECDACHGPVRLRDRLRKEKETSMKACMDCHRLNGASNDCQLCHEVAF